MRVVYKIFTYKSGFAVNEMEHHVNNMVIVFI